MIVTTEGVEPTLLQLSHK